MTRESRQALAGVLKTAVVDSLIASNEFDVPKALVDDEIDRLRQQAVQQYGGGKMDPSSLPAELFQEQAVRRVKVGLIMSDIISTHELKADDAAVTAYLEDMAAVYQEPASVIEYYRNNPEQMSQVQAVVIEEAVIQKVLSASKVTEKAVKYDDAIKLARG
jgi:trigger factor